MYAIQMSFRPNWRGIKPLFIKTDKDIQKYKKAINYLPPTLQLFQHAILLY
jgi:hypothetical protein